MNSSTTPNEMHGRRTIESVYLGFVLPSVGNPYLAAIDPHRYDSVRVCVHVSCVHVCESMCACSWFS